MLQYLLPSLSPKNSESSKNSLIFLLKTAKKKVLEIQVITTTLDTIAIAIL